MPGLKYKLVLLLLLVGVLSASAHTTSVTSVDVRLTTNMIVLSVQLNQPDLLQIAREGPKDKFFYDNQEDFRTNAAWIAEYVTNRVLVTFDDTNRAGVVSNWPPAEPELTIEVRPDDVQPMPLPFNIAWKIPSDAKELKLKFNLYDNPGFSALFQVLFDLGPDSMPVMHVAAGGKDTVIDLTALAEDMAEDEPEPEPAKPTPPPLTTNAVTTNVVTTNFVTTNVVVTNFTTNVVATNATVEPDEPAAPKPVRIVQFDSTEFIEIGFVHILPRGLDHILFVLALFLLNTNWKPLLGQVTAFTVAHSLTLALAMNGVLNVPAKFVEPIIALSIAAVAIENLFADKVSRWRWIGVFIFGLIHGLGFAGVMSELTIPEGQFGWSLLWFNVGVELGQLAVIALAWIVMVGKTEQSWYPKYVRAPLCWLLAAIGLFWTVERIFFNG
ncbi:MAG: HupE/UreJ family protein [Limisphaerales bacterium]